MHGTGSRWALGLAIAFVLYGNSASADDSLPKFIQYNICIAVNALHIENQYGASENARTVSWGQPEPVSGGGHAGRNELRLCFFKRGTQIAVRAYSWLNNKWNGPHISGLREVLIKRDLFGEKVDAGCIAIRRELPGGYGRLKHVMKSGKVCDIHRKFKIHHERVIDEGDTKDGKPIRILRKIFTAEIIHSEQPIPDS